MNINYKQIAQIILNITFVSTIIGVLFFTYGKGVEQAIVKDQSEYISKSMATDLKVFFPDKTRQSIASQLTVPDMSAADADVETSNSQLELTAKKVLGCVFVVGVIITLIICWFGKVNKTHVFVEAGVILVFVIATEVAFLNLIGRNYKSADPNHVKCEILRSIKSAFPQNK